jgi:hypothetical protein
MTRPFFEATPAEAVAAPATRARHSIRARVTARLRAGRYDRALAVGVPADAGTPLAAHADRLVETAEREAIARTLRLAVRDAHATHATFTTRTEVNAPAVRAAEAAIDAVTLRLHAPLPVHPRGMARLRVLLADGRGPLYRYGRGDLAGRLGAALAAL